MDKDQPVPGPLADRHDLVRTVCVWRNGTCYRIEIIRRCGDSDGQSSYAALLWAEEEQAGKRILVRDVGFPWTHHQSAEAALEIALDSLSARLRYSSTGEVEV